MLDTVNDPANLAIFPDYGKSATQTDLTQLGMVDFSYVPVNAPTQAASVWEDLSQDVSDAVSGTGDYIWNGATGAWDTVKSAASGAVNSAGEALSSVTSAVGSTADGLLGGIEKHLFIILGGLLIILVVLAKSGVITQATGLLGAIYGG